MWLTRSTKGLSANNNGGYRYQMANHVFTNSPNRFKWRWQHEAVYEDLDGSLTSSLTTGNRVLPSSEIIPDDRCIPAPQFSSSSRSYST